MNTLFSIAPQFPEGFRYFPDFITEAEEAALLREVAAISLHTFTFQGYEAKRKVASFGQDWSFEKRTLSPGAPIPGVFHPLVDKVAQQLSVPAGAFRELLVTEYPEGSVIN